MKSRPGIVVLAASLALTQACGTNEPPPQQASAAPTVQVDAPRTEDSTCEDESFDALFKEAGEEFAVPPALLKSISFVQTRYQMVEGDEEFEGRPAVYGMMALTSAQLEEGAKLAGGTAEQARTDARSHARAAAAMLSRHAEALKVDRTQAAASTGRRRQERTRCMAPSDIIAGHADDHCVLAVAHHQPALDEPVAELLGRHEAPELPVGIAHASRLDHHRPA